MPMSTNPSPTPLPPAEPGTVTSIGTATFVVTRLYAGSRPISDLLLQRMRQAAAPSPSIDEEAGTAV